MSHTTPSTGADAPQTTRGRGLSLGTRLIGAFAAMASLTLVASLVAFFAYDRIQSGFERIETKGIPAMSRTLTLARQAADYSARAAMLLGSNDDKELHAGVANLRDALQQMAASLDTTVAGGADDGVVNRIKDEFRALGADAGRLAESVESRLALAKERARLVDDAEAAHDRLARLIAPALDSAQFDLEIGLQGAMDDEAAKQLEQKAAAVQSLELLTAESNLIVGVLVEASLADQVELLTPFRDRLTASAAKAEKAAATLGTDTEARQTLQALRALIAFGQKDQDIFAARRRQLDEFVVERNIVAESQQTTAQLASDVQKLVALAQDVSTAAIASSRMSIIRSRYLLMGLALFSFVAALAIGWIQLGRGVLGAVAQLHKSVLRLAEGDLTVEIPATIKTQADELGDMARAVQVFKDNAIERGRIESNAELARETAAAERERNLAERAKAAAEQGDVVRRLGAGLKRLASGDLTEPLSDDFARDYAQIRADFNDALSRLSATLLGVVSGVRTIQSGSGQITAAADNLSKRAAEQASSLKETAAALDNITATVKKSAEGAAQARAVVQAAHKDAGKNVGVVHAAVEAMGAISKSSQQVTRIIGVIDEIAFQTNLLALNAGVEAARAGEAGRGFAVVASEVRALAQRSTGAAKEIKALLSESRTQVERGVELVGATGKSLGRITDQMAEINSVVDEIANGAANQAAGLNEVNAAINRVDQATHQNAAMAEESTIASHTLAWESAELARLVEQFRISQAPAGDTLRDELKRVAPHAFPPETPVRSTAKVRASRGSNRASLAQ